MFYEIAMCVALFFCLGEKKVKKTCEMLILKLSNSGDDITTKCAYTLSIIIYHMKKNNYGGTLRSHSTLFSLKTIVPNAFSLKISYYFIIFCVVCAFDL